MISATDAVKAALDEALAQNRLLDSRFYKSWSEGCLPVEGLRRYAAEYGAFIRLLPLGWSVQGDEETADEELEHAELWEKFADGLETDISQPETPAVQKLIAVTNELFADPVLSLGALYAFEAQQPETAKSKLAGLQKHYPQITGGEEYFEIHSCNEHEAEKILERCSKLAPADRTRAAEACQRMSRALLEALDGIYDAVH